MADESTVFRLEGVSKRYGDIVALDDVSISVRGNEYISLLGPSGSGKTTLLRVIAGFEAPEKGRIEIEGRDITSLPAHERGIGFVFQNFALFPHLSVLANVTFGLLHGRVPVSEREAEGRAREVIAMVGLEGLETRGVDQISGGQKQRVALARTLVMEPRLVLLDEPLGALDANLRGRMRDELRTIRKRLGVTFLHVTGSETEALTMGDRVVVLDKGRILQFGVPDDIYSRPASRDVARFLNRYNLFDGRLEGNYFIGPFGKAPVANVQPSGRPAYGVRYDRMTVTDIGSAGEGPVLRARYLASEYLGSSVMYFYETAEGQVIEVEHHLSYGAPATCEPRREYDLRWNPEDAIVFG